MIKMLIVVVLCYTVCWLPFNIFWVMNLDVTRGPEPYAFTIVHILALFHTCLNPVICVWMNSKVRHGFVEVFGKPKR